MQNNGSDRLKRLSGMCIYSLKSLYNKIIINT